MPSGQYHLSNNTNAIQFHAERAVHKPVDMFPGKWRWMFTMQTITPMPPAHFEDLDVGEVYDISQDDILHRWIYTTDRPPVSDVVDWVVVRAGTPVPVTNKSKQRKKKAVTKKQALNDLVGELYSEDQTTGIRKQAEHVLSFWRDVLTRQLEQSVIAFTVPARQDPYRKPLEYAALKINDQWYLTGQAGRSALTELELIQWFIDYDVVTVRIMTLNDTLTMPSLPAIDVTSSTSHELSSLD